MLSRDTLISQIDEEEQMGEPTSTRKLPFAKALLAMCAVGFVLGVGVTCIPSIFHGNTDGISEKSLQALEQLDFKIPANPIDQIRAKALEPLEEKREKWGIRKLREDEIALCVTNLNLGLWKIIQFGAVITEATENCPAGFTNVDKKIACNINMAAVVASASAATSFLASTAFLCPGQDKPRAGCTTILAATFEQLATVPAAENQLALFCPKNAEQQTIIQGGVRVYQAGSRRLGTANASNRELQTPVQPLCLIFLIVPLCSTVL